MPFLVLPVIDTMLGLYGQPLGYQRFCDYLQLVQGNTKGDMVLPIGNYNPMAKEHVAERLKQLKALDAEDIMASTARDFSLATATTKEYQLVLNLADDLKGGWTNRHTTDYQTKFQAQAVAKRGFCTPVFWTSEEYTPPLIALRTREYMARTLWLEQHGKPMSLTQHVAQEQFVAQHSSVHTSPPNPDIALYYQAHKDTTDYSIIFNFMYGDKACRQLGYPVFGIAQANAGFIFATGLQ